MIVMENLNRQHILLFLIMFFQYGKTSANDVVPTLQPVANWPKYSDFGQISAVSVDTSGNVFVFHRGNRVWDSHTFSLDVFQNQDEGPIKNSTIVVLNPTTGELIQKTGENRFYLPHGLTLDHENNIWITDVAMHQVFKFPPLNLSSTTVTLGEPLLTLGTKFKNGKDDNHFCKPTDVAVVKSSGDFFVSDGYCNSRIMKFDKNGKLLMSWGKRSIQGAIDGYTLFIPHALALAEDKGLLFVADRENQRVVSYNSSSGCFVKEYATKMEITIYSVAYCPYHGGLLYALGSNSKAPFRRANVIQNVASVYEVDSNKLLFQISPPNRFTSPHDIAVSNDGNFSYVVELNKKIWKFQTAISDKTHKIVKTQASEKSVEPEDTNQSASALKDDDFLNGTSMAVTLVTIIILVSLLFFLFHIQKKKGAYRRSEMRGLILDDDDEEGVNLQ